ncbi:hypothetical protein AB0J37_06860 [Microbispora rosea]|uniref:hypothetical protein n=1 Tax=Microbispora rosea TaxID=58117 RepID=UPI0034391F5F
MVVSMMQTLTVPILGVIRREPAEHLATRASPLPAEGRFTVCFALGAGAFVLVVLVALAGLTNARPFVRPRHGTRLPERWKTWH